MSFVELATGLDKFCLKAHTIFGEEIKVSKQRSLFEIRYIAEPFLRNFIKPRHWCVDRADGIIDEDELMDGVAEIAAQTLLAHATPLPKSNQNVIVLGDEGVGKSSLLYYMYEESIELFKRFATGTVKPNGKPNSLINALNSADNTFESYPIPLFIDAQELVRQIQQNQDKISLDIVVDSASKCLEVKTKTTKATTNDTEESSSEKMEVDSNDEESGKAEEAEEHTVAFSDIKPKMIEAIMQNGFLLLIDNLDLLSSKACIDLLQKLSEFTSAQTFSNKASKARFIISVRPATAFSIFDQHATDTAEVKKTLTFILQQPGPTFHVSSACDDEIKNLLASWPTVVDSSFSPSRKSNLVDALRQHSKKLAPPQVAYPTIVFSVVKRLSKNESNADGEFTLVELYEGILDDICSLFINEPTAPESQMEEKEEKAEAKEEKVQNKTIWRTKEALKRACSLAAFLCHWLVDSKVEITNHVEFILMQMRNLLASEKTAYLLGITSNLPAEQIVDAVFETMRLFYKRGTNGKLLCTHTSFEEFLVARFISEGEDYVQPITNTFQHSITLDEQEISLAQFSWYNAHFLSSTNWDMAIHFAGVRKGIEWLASHILNTSKTVHQWLASLSSASTDKQDLGQLRFHLLLRVYADICLHRSTHKTQFDPLTFSFSGAIGQLLRKQSAATLLHIEAFPIYYLSCFNGKTAQQITDVCIDLLLSRSTTHSILLAFRLHYSPYMPSKLGEVIAQCDSTNSRTCIVKLVKKIDEHRLQKEYLTDVINSSLVDCEGHIRSVAFSYLYDIGYAAVRYLSPEAHQLFFPANDADKVISSAISLLMGLVKYIDIDRSSEDKFMRFYYRNLTSIMALLQQPDPRVRLLVFLALGTHRTLLFSSPTQDEVSAKKEASAVCKEICKTTPPPTSTSTNSQDFRFTVALSNLIAEHLGENASCWASSMLEVLQQNYRIISSVSVSLISKLEPAEQDKLLLTLLAMKGNALKEVLRILTRLPVELTKRNLKHIISILLGSAEVASEDPQMLRKTSGALQSSKGTSTPVRDSTTFSAANVTNTEVRILAASLYKHVLVHGNPESLSFDLIAQLVTDSNPQIVTAIVDLWNAVIEVMDTTKLNEDQVNAVFKLIASHSMHPYHVVIAAIKQIELLPQITKKLANSFPLEELLSHPNANVRKHTMRVVGRHDYAFQKYISRIARLFQVKSYYSRSAAICALAMLAKSDLRKSALLQSVNEKSADGTDSREPNAIYNEVSKTISALLVNTATDPHILECAIRTLQTIGQGTKEAKDKVASIVAQNSTNSRLLVAAIDCVVALEDIAMDNVSALVNCMINVDFEVRCTASNALDALSAASNFAPNTKEMHDFVEQYAVDSTPFKREGAIKVLEICGTEFIIQHAEQVNKLLLDYKRYIRIRIMEILRKAMEDSQGATIFAPAVVSQLQIRDHRVRTEALRLLRCNKQCAMNNAEAAGQLLLGHAETIKVKKQALLLLGEIDMLTPDYIHSIFKMLDTKEARILGSITNAFMYIGAKFSKIVPCLVTYHQNVRIMLGIKRKLTRFMCMHLDDLRIYVEQLLPDLLLMTRLEDSVLRRKGVELIRLLVVPEINSNMFSSTTWDSLIKELVRLLVDRNSLVRREAAIAVGAIGKSKEEYVATILRTMFTTERQALSYSLPTWRLLSLKWKRLIAIPPKRKRLDLKKK